MKKRLAKWFLLVAKRLDPETHVENAKVIEDYDARKIGLTYELTKKDIKYYRSKKGTKVSLNERKRELVRDVEQKIQQEILNSIVSNRLIEYEVRKESGGYLVGGELKVYIRK